MSDDMIRKPAGVTVYEGVMLAESVQLFVCPAGTFHINFKDGDGKPFAQGRIAAENIQHVKNWIAAIEERVRLTPEQVALADAVVAGNG